MYRRLACQSISDVHPVLCRVSSMPRRSKRFYRKSSLHTWQLHKMLIHDRFGNCVVDARSLTIDMSKLGQPPQASCKVYPGIYEPSDAVKKQWLVSEMRFVDAGAFQKLVDAGLQTAPAAAPAAVRHNDTKMTSPASPASPTSAQRASERLYDVVPLTGAVPARSTQPQNPPKAGN